jgi:polysaccharide export outer membrane protein
MKTRFHTLCTGIACAILSIGMVPKLAASADQLAYTLTELDAVSIQVFGEPDLSKEQRIDGEGNIRMGLIGTIGIAGLTLREAEAKMQQVYVEKRYLRDPQISIQVTEYAPRYVSVLGKVNKPGRVQLEQESNGIRLVDAISAVGGFSGIAKADAVRITRTGANGEETTVVIDAEALINGRNTDTPEEFESLLPGDVVFVPERLF